MQDKEVIETIIDVLADWGAPVLVICQIIVNLL